MITWVLGLTYPACMDTYTNIEEANRVVVDIGNFHLFGRKLRTIFLTVVRDDVLAH